MWCWISPAPYRVPKSTARGDYIYVLTAVFVNVTIGRPEQLLQYLKHLAAYVEGCGSRAVVHTWIRVKIDKPDYLFADFYGVAISGWVN